MKKMRQNKATLVLSVITLFLCRVTNADVLNGSFETGNSTGWLFSGTGSVQVVTQEQLTPLRPTDGSYFALLGNGPGDVNLDGITDDTRLSTEFIVPERGGILSFDWDFLTSEFTGSQALTSGLDAYRVSVVSQSGISLLLQGNVSEVGFNSIDSGDIVTSPDGTSLIEHLGFRRQSLPLDKGIYSLIFEVQDVGDPYFDSALLIDRVTFSSTVPELSSGWAIIVGLATLPVCYWIRRRFRVMTNRV